MYGSLKYSSLWSWSRSIYLPMTDDSAARRGSLLRLLPCRLRTGFGGINSSSSGNPWASPAWLLSDNLLCPPAPASPLFFCFLDPVLSSSFTTPWTIFRGLPRFFFCVGWSSSPVLLPEAWSLTAAAGSFFLAFTIYKSSIGIKKAQIWHQRKVAAPYISQSFETMRSAHQRSKPRLRCPHDYTFIFLTLKCQTVSGWSTKAYEQYESAIGLRRSSTHPDKASHLQHLSFESRLISSLRNPNQK